MMPNPPKMYKKWEYNQFLEYVKQHRPERAIIYAKALGIDRRTLLKWLEQPELKHHMTEAVDQILNNMQAAGKDDWRMWKELYSMAGLDDKTKIDHTSDNEPIKVALVEFIDEPSEDTNTE